MSALYPDVPPSGGGVPAVFRRVDGFVGAEPPRLAQDALRGSSAGRVTWGIFDDGGAPALFVDSIVSVEPRGEFRISDYPVEAGGFRSYNKVALPSELRVTVTKGGTDASRSTFLAAVETLRTGTKLCSIVTPDSAFRSYNLVAVDYRRTAGAGVSLLSVELNFEEVRQSATSAFTASGGKSDPGNAPKRPSGADPVSIGPVQPATPTAAQTPVHGPQ